MSIFRKRSKAPVPADAPDVEAIIARDDRLFLVGEYEGPVAGRSDGAVALNRGEQRMIFSGGMHDLFMMLMTSPRYSELAPELPALNVSDPAEDMVRAMLAQGLVAPSGETSTFERYTLDVNLTDLGPYHLDPARSVVRLADGREAVVSATTVLAAQYYRERLDRGRPVSLRAGAEHVAEGLGNLEMAPWLLDVLASQDLQPLILFGDGYLDVLP